MEVEDKDWSSLCFPFPWAGSMLVSTTDLQRDCISFVFQFQTRFLYYKSNILGKKFQLISTKSYVVSGTSSLYLILCTRFPRTASYLFLTYLSRVNTCRHANILFSFSFLPHIVTNYTHNFVSCFLSFYVYFRKHSMGICLYQSHVFKIFIVVVQAVDGIIYLINLLMIGINCL